MKKDEIAYIKMPFPYFNIGITTDWFDYCDPANKKEKAHLEGQVLSDLQRYANVYERPIVLRKGFIKTLEPETLANENLVKGKMIRPKEYKIACFVVKPDDQFDREESERDNGSEQLSIDFETECNTDSVKSIEKE